MISRGCSWVALKKSLPSMAANNDVKAPGGEPPKDAPVKKAKEYKWGKYNPLKRLFFIDIDPLISHGFGTRLEPKDMYAEPSVGTSHLLRHFNPALEAELKKEQPDLKRAVIAGNGPLLLWTAVLYLVSQACSLAGPLLLNRIVKGLTCKGLQQQLGPRIQCEDQNTLY